MVIYGTIIKGVNINVCSECIHVPFKDFQDVILGQNRICL